MKALVFGARGFLGSRLVQALDAVPSTGDITDFQTVHEAICESKPDVVINAAGKTGSSSNVDWCEFNQEDTYRSNVVGPLTIADACRREGVHFVHLGSGCIFYGRSPHPDGLWREEDHANPVSFYSRSKYAVDLMLSCLSNVAIVRLRMPIDSTPSPRNLISKLAVYTRVVDVTNSVTVVDDLLHVVKEIAEQRLTGIFHATNPGTIRHAEILALYRELVDPNHRCEMITEEALVSEGLVAKQRSNCVLASERLETAGIRMRPVQEAVRDAMVQYGETWRRERCL